MRGKLMLWGAAVAAVLGSTVAIANVVVVKSLGPSSKAYPPGKTLPESAKISLQGGDVVTLLGPGSASTLRGPGNFAAGQVAMNNVASRGRFGALRAAEVARNPSICDIDVSKIGKVCITDASRVQLWRPENESELKVEIRTADGKSGELAWAAGRSSTYWPATLPIKTGSKIQIEWPDSGEVSTVTFIAVPNMPPDLMGTAQTLIEHGCQHQLDLLVDAASKRS